MTGSDVVAAAAIGAGATLVMDLWNLFLKRAFGIPSLSYCLLGRWILHMPAGTFRHSSIGAALPRSRECLTGWVAHYTIGITFGVLFLSLVSAGWLASPTLPPALLFGLVTAIFPLGVMQPAFGLGIASSRAPHPARARLKSLVTHTVFGIGLYACGLAAGLILRGLG